MCKTKSAKSKHGYPVTDATLGGQNVKSVNQ